MKKNKVIMGCAVVLLAAAVMGAIATAFDSEEEYIEVEDGKKTDEE